MTQTYQARWGSDTVEISAVWSLSDSEVIGTDGQQVADFRHWPRRAMRYVLERFAMDCGEDIESDEVSEAIDQALAEMREVAHA